MACSFVEFNHLRTSFNSPKAQRAAQQKPIMGMDGSPPPAMDFNWVLKPQETTP